MIECTETRSCLGHDSILQKKIFIYYLEYESVNRKDLFLKINDVILKENNEILTLDFSRLLCFFLQNFSLCGKLNNG